MIRGPLSAEDNGRLQTMHHHRHRMSSFKKKNIENTKEEQIYFKNGHITRVLPDLGTRIMLVVSDFIVFICN